MGTSAHSMLDSGAHAWNSWRQTKAGLKPSLVGVNLTHRNYISYDFSHCDLSSADLSRSTFSGCNFERAVLNGCTASHAHFGGASLVQASFKGGKLQDVNLGGAKLLSADFSHSNITRTNLKACNAERSSFYGASITDSEFWHADLMKSDFSAANIRRTTFRHCTAAGAIFRGATISRSNITEAVFEHAEFSDSVIELCNFEATKLGHGVFKGAKIGNCDFRRSDLNSANLDAAKVRQTSLSNCNLLFSTLRNALIENSNLEFASLSNADASGSTFFDCRIYGVSVWGTNFTDATEENLIITRSSEFGISVSSFEFALFVHQCISNEKMRKFFDTSAEKLVLVLGRFVPERKLYLEAVRATIRKRGYVPIIFDFEKPDSKDLTQTILALALMVRFVVVDLSEPSSAPHEIATIAPQISIPIAPIIQAGKRPYAMFADLQNRYRWVLDVLTYEDVADLAGDVTELLVGRCEDYIVRNASMTPTQSAK